MRFVSLNLMKEVDQTVKNRVRNSIKQMCCFEKSFLSLRVYDPAPSSEGAYTINLCINSTFSDGKTSIYYKNISFKITDNLISVCGEINRLYRFIGTVDDFFRYDILNISANGVAKVSCTSRSVN